MFNEHFPDGGYEDVLGLCKIASIDEIEKQGWSLNPGRYVGVKIETLNEGVFKEKMALIRRSVTDNGRATHTP